MIKEIFPPTEKCLRCNKYLVGRITIMGNKVYDCPECQAVYEEDTESEDSLHKEKK